MYHSSSFNFKNYFPSVKFACGSCTFACGRCVSPVVSLLACLHGGHGLISPLKQILDIDLGP